MDKTKQLFVALVLILIVSSWFGYQLLLPAFQQTSFYQKANRYYQSNTWVTYKSKRGRFSFKHPISWPVAVAPDSALVDPWPDDELNHTDVENIIFDDAGWYPNAGGGALGYIFVKRLRGELKSVVTLDDYRRLIDKESSIFITGRGMQAKIPAPEIKELTLGGEKALSVRDRSTIGSFESQELDYRLIKNGWLYRFILNGRSETTDQEREIFRKLIESVKFD